jgi:hypothetical protein
MIFYVLSIQEKSKNKTVRYLDKKGFDYKVLIPDCYSELAESYKEKAIVYDTKLCKSYVDFCGTNIENGAAVGRVASIFETKKSGEICVCLDDDYGGGLTASKPLNQYNKDRLTYVIDKLYKLTKETGIIFGGYSSGAYPATKFNIMQVWIMDKNWNLTDLNMILNEDVNFSISKWQRGTANFGLATLIRSNAQTAEMDKIDGNTKHIYATDRSYRKSFGSILQDPNNAKLTINRHNTKRGALWHHRISWSKITPKILDNGIR